MHDIHISIVSHKQFDLVQKLLNDLEQQDCKNRLQVTVTVNTPETINSDLTIYSYPIHFVHNTHCRGFSENHNAAFKLHHIKNECKYFLISNPDVRLKESTIMHLTNALEDNYIGIVAPITYGPDEKLEDSARELPTPSRIIAKMFGKKGIWKLNKHNQPDWVAGMFMAFRSDVFKEMHGFDENYFLYYEDVDICSRLWLKGYTILVDQSASITHDAQRSSRRNPRYLLWHISSMLRFFRSETYKKIKPFHQQRKYLN